MVNESKESVSKVGVKYTEKDGGVYDNNRYWNGVAFRKPFRTKQLRLTVYRAEGSADTAGIGIGEWEVFGKVVGVSIGQGQNIARIAKPDAQYENTPVTNVNNGKLATGDAGTSWNTWNNPNAYPTWVTLEWEDPYLLESMQVMYWADNATLTANGNVTFPKSCFAQYLDNATGEWIDITDMSNEDNENVSSVGVKFNGNSGGINANNRYWNGVQFNKAVRTTKLRLLIDRNGRGSNGVGIGEWEVFGQRITDELFGAKITGKDKIAEEETAVYTGSTSPAEVGDKVTYAWSISQEDQDKIQIQGRTDEPTVSVKGLKIGTGTLKLTVSDGQLTKEREFSVRVEGVESIDRYVTTTAAGKAPILPETVVVNGISFDDPTPSLKSTTKPDFDFAETFDSKLMAVTWENVDPASYGADQVGKTFTVKGKVQYGDLSLDAFADITVKEPAVTAVANSTVTFENVQLNDIFWSPKQKVNALNSLNKAILEISKSSGGEPNFDNAIKKLNGQPYNAFSGYVFQDSDIYKSIEAISYTLSATQNDNSEEMSAQRATLEKKLNEWIEKIGKVQYADGYIDTFFTLRSKTNPGGGSQGTHRFRNMSNHELYNAGHFLESVVAYTRYREGINDPDYRLYVTGKRFADLIVNLFGPNGKRHEVPGHEEVELALVKFGKLAEEYEGEGSGQKYFDTAKLLIDRRGESSSLRESGYRGNDYSQDARPFVNETNGVGHAVRANYFYAGVTDIATLLEDGDEDKAAYLKSLDAIWDSVANRKTYITGGIGVRTHGEDFGNDYELPNNNSYCETCAAIALANWNQRMNLVHEDAKYADVVERTLYNAILVGTNLDGNRFFYSSLLEVGNGNGRSEWFACACCPPNLMRTIAALSGYMYTVHKDNVFVNMYIGSDGKVNVDGTQVDLKQETNYPWDGNVKLTVNPAAEKEFTMKIRIPGWVQEQKNKNVTIQVNGEAVTEKAEKGYVAIRRNWKKGDVIAIDLPMEIRKTEANPKVTTNAGRIALERGPVVYCMEKAGNAQLNSEISNFNPLNFVIPRDADLKAEYNETLLKGVVEITGDVTYNNGSETIPAKLQAVPYYAWNNRGDNDIYGQNNGTKMLIWTKASGEAPDRAVEEAIEKINAIGTVEATEACRARIEAARAAYDALSEAQQAKVTNAKTLTDAEAEYERLMEEEHAVEWAIQLIDRVGVVSLDSKAAIEAARTAYNGLNDEQKALVTNLDVLEIAEKTLQKLEADKVSANKVAELIGKIGEVTYNSKQAIEAARKAFDQLTSSQKGMVENLDKLTTAEQAYAAMTAGDEAAAGVVADMIAGLDSIDADSRNVIQAVRAAYDALTGEQKKLVKNVNVLTAAEKAIEGLENKAAADEVSALIGALKNVTLRDASKVETARAAYEGLTSAQKALVTNVNVLTAAESTLKKLEQQAADKDKADEVMVLISRIGSVNSESEDAIEAARRAYEKLTDAQKALVSNVDILTAAEKAFADLGADKKAADSVTALINKIGTVGRESGEAIEAARKAYDALTPSQKTMVGNLDTLTKAEQAYAGMTSGDAAAAGVVENMIRNLGTITLDSENVIKAVRAAYDSLTDAQKSLVGNAEDLAKAEKTLTDLKNQKPETPVQLAAPEVKSVKSSISKKEAGRVKITVSRAEAGQTVEVYRKVGSSVKLVGSTTGTFVYDAKPVSGKKASYYAKAVSKDTAKYTDSADSKAVSITLPADTRKVTVKALGRKQVRITWSKVKGAKKYYIYRSASKNSGYMRIASLKAAKRTYTDKKAKAGKKYYYKIVTQKSGGYSGGKISRAVKVKK